MRAPWRDPGWGGTLGFFVRGMLEHTKAQDGVLQGNPVIMWKRTYLCHFAHGGLTRVGVVSKLSESFPKLRSTAGKSPRPESHVAVFGFDPDLVFKQEAYGNISEPQKMSNRVTSLLAHPHQSRKPETGEYKIQLSFLLQLFQGDLH